MNGGQPYRNLTREFRATKTTCNELQVYEQVTKILAP
jgi:hypothetical protein